MSATPVFQGFGPQSLAFFTALAFHQSREWMADNKNLYETQVRQPMGLLLEQLSAEFVRREVPLQGNLKTSMFRLNRDVRFARDKALYKTAAGAVMTRSGSKGEQGLLYINLDPKGCFVACGVYQPLPAQLAEIRRDIVARSEVFRQACTAMPDLSLDSGDSLTRAPRGFEAVTEPDLAAALRMRSLIFRMPVPEADIFTAGLADTLAGFAEQALPFLRFAWNAVDRVPMDERAEAPRKGKVSG